MAGILLLSAACPAAAGKVSGQQEITVLFTHDLHSHFLPQPTEGGGQSGGYARLKTALDRERWRHPDALTLDGGDISIGSLIQTVYTSAAAELRTMGAMGYDATTAGNHEFDHTGVGFAQMLRAAALSGDKVPAFLMSNYRPDPKSENCPEIQRAMALYGVKESLLLERGGIVYGIFGLMGEDAHSCVVPSSGFVLKDPIESAEHCVEELKSQGAEVIICLSHAGTNEKKKKSEDEQLAERVEGIDLIVSGHTHRTLPEPIKVGETYIVSAGPYCRNLGSITFSRDSTTGEKTLKEYSLIPINEDLPEDPVIADMVEDWKKRADSSYLSRYAFTYDEVLTSVPFDMKTPNYRVQEGNTLGELVSDSYLWAADQLAEGGSAETDTVAVVAAGVLRAPLTEGPVSVSQAFDVLSMGVGTDGTSGFPLIACYLTGKELRAAAELDASITPIMPEAQLYFSGLAHSFNVHRIFFNRVTGAGLVEPTFGAGPISRDKIEKLDDDRLYRIVTGMYSAQMLGTVKSRSMGLLSLEPKMADGSAVTDFESCILRDARGNEIKEWYALAAYLDTFGNGGLPGGYAETNGGKTVSRSWSPVQLLKSPNWITLSVLGICILLAVLVVLLARHVKKLKKQRRYGSRHRSRCGF